jgi:hypothetical protein
MGKTQSRSLALVLLQRKRHGLKLPQLLPTSSIIDKKETALCQKGSPHLVVIEKIYAKKSMVLKMALLMEGAGECDMLINEENYFNVQNIAAEQDLSLSFNEDQLMVEFENP